MKVMKHVPLRRLVFAAIWQEDTLEVSTGVFRVD